MRKSGQARFIDSLRVKATIQACMLTCRSPSRMASILLSHGMIARERVWYVRVFLLHNGSRDIAALSERAAPQEIPQPGRRGPTPSYFVAMVFLSSGVSGMTRMLQTSIMTNYLSPSSGQASPCWHYDEVSGTEHWQHEFPTTLAIAPLRSMQEIYMCLACIVRRLRAS